MIANHPVFLCLMLVFLRVAAIDDIVTVLVHLLLKYAVLLVTR
jgi:hypothetical protein